MPPSGLVAVVPIEVRDNVEDVLHAQLDCQDQDAEFQEVEEQWES
jgi:hypothetical protein